MLASRMCRAAARVVGRAAAAGPGRFGAGTRQMSSLEGTKTLQNLKDAFAGESLARARYLFFAQRADVEGYSEVAAAFREVAASEEAQAMGHLEWLQEFGDPVSNQPMGSTKENLNCAIVGETFDADACKEAAALAKKEGLEDAAYWFESVGSADTKHKIRFAKALKEVP